MTIGNHPMSSIPPKMASIIEDFQLCEGREKLELLIQFAESLPPLPDWVKEHHEQMDPIPECMTPVKVVSESQANLLYFHFDAPAESPMVRGFASFMKQGLDGSHAEEILQVPGDFFTQMGLEKVLTHQRLNGLSAILAHMKQLAVKQIKTS